MAGNIKIVSKIESNPVGKKNISGLLDGDAVAGIIKLQDNKPIALLNQNPKCNYGVFIGKDKALGITHGMENSQNILVSFIPLWNDIKEGDEYIDIYIRYLGACSSCAASSTGTLFAIENILKEKLSKKIRVLPI